MQIAPSLLSADFLHLEKDLRMLNESADILHLDVMDGTQVPNISFGFSVLDPLSKVVTIPMDVHLMVVEPQRWFKKVADDGASTCSFHYEAALSHTAEYLSQIRSLGMKAGVAINPDIPVERLFEFVDKADFILIMSVFAGFGGQKFIPASIERVKALKEHILLSSSDTLIEIDGGVSLDNAAVLREAGVDIAVAGSSVFKAEDPAAMIAALRQA